MKGPLVEFLLLIASFALISFIVFSDPGKLVTNWGLIYTIGSAFFFPLLVILIFNRLIEIFNPSPTNAEFFFLFITLSAGIPTLLFGLFYYQSGKMSGAVSGIVDSLYFSTKTFVTLGLGEASPQTILEKVAVSFESLFGYIFLGMVVSLFVKALKD